MVRRTVRAPQRHVDRQDPESPPPRDGGRPRRSVSAPRNNNSNRAPPPASASAQRRSRSADRQHAMLREIQRLQSTTRLMVPRLPFGRLIREVLQQYQHTDLRITLEALNCLQESAEVYMTQLFEDAYRCTLHRGRVTLLPKDMQLVMYLREKWIR